MANGNITEYNAPGGLGLQPSETGIETNAQAGRRIGAFYNQGGEALANTGQRVGRAIEQDSKVADDYVTHRQISVGAAAEAGMTSDLTQKWNDTVKNADPNDPTVAAKFKEEVLEPALEKFNSGFITDRGSDWAQNRVEALRNHFNTKTTADMSSLAADAVSTNIKSMADNFSATVHGDPTSLDHALSTIDSSVGDLISTSPNLSGVAAGKVKTELTQSMKEAVVKSAVVGAIEKNPDAGLLLASDPKYAPYVNGAEMKTFATYAKSMQASMRRDDMAAKAEARAERTFQSQTVAQDYHAQLVDPDTNAVRVPSGWFQSILKDRRVLPGEQEALFRMGDKVTADGDKATTKPGLLNDLLMRSTLPDSDPRKTTPKEVYSHVGNDMKNADAQFVLGQMKAENTGTTNMLKSAVDTAHAQITPNAIPGRLTADQADKQFRFQTWFYPKYQELTAGANGQPAKSPADAIKELVTPENLAPFKVSSGALAAKKSWFWSSDDSGKAPVTNTPPPSDRVNAAKQFMFGGGK